MNPNDGRCREKDSKKGRTFDMLIPKIGFPDQSGGTAQ
jgi:hypothetical protein